MAIRGVDHIDLAVSDVERSLAFYLGMLGPIGLAAEGRFRTYRGTEDVVYLGFGQEHVPGAQPETRLGLRKADGGEHRYFEVGIEHLAFTVDSRSEVDDTHERCLGMNAPMGSGSRSVTGPIRCESNGTRGSISRLSPSRLARHPVSDWAAMRPPRTPGSKAA